MERLDRQGEFEAELSAWYSAPGNALALDEAPPRPPAATPYERLDEADINGPEIAWDPAAARPAEPPTAAARPGPATPTGWVDLAANKAGQGVALVAADHRKARPVTSRLERLFGVHSDAQAWAKGTAGERATAKALRPLLRPWTGRLLRRAPRWRVLHSVPLGTTGTDIDHILIGPPGVFTINTKNHHGKNVWVGDHELVVDRHPVRYAVKARAEARRAADRLNRASGNAPAVLAFPIVAVVGATVTGRPETADGVLVADIRKLRSRLRYRPDVLSSEQVDALYAVARRSTTWTDELPKTTRI